MQKTILLNIPGPLTIRNYLLIPDGVFEILKKEGFKIVLVVPEPAYESVSKDFGGGDVFVESVVVNHKKNFVQRVFTFVTYYLNFTDVARLFARLGVRIDIPVAGGRPHLYYVKVFINSTLGKSKWVREWLTPRLDNLVYRERPYRFLFEKYKPDFVFLPDILSLQSVNLIREAKRQGIKTMGMPGSWDHFPKRFEPLHVDKLLVWNEAIKEEAIEYQNYKDENTTVVGVPQYDLFAKSELFMTRDEFVNKYGLDKDKKIIFFSSSTKYAPDDGDVVDILLKAVKSGEIKHDSQLFVRPYPGVAPEHKKFDKFNDEELVYINWIKEKKVFGHSGFAWYPTLDDIVSFMNMLKHSDVIISTYSTVSVEASAFDKPIININFDGYKDRPFETSVKRFKHFTHFNHVSSTNGVHHAQDKGDLIETVNKFLANPKANSENVAKLCEKMCWKIDGGTSKRIADRIISSV